MVAAPATPAFAVSKEIIQLQTQVQDLADRMATMQQSFDERMGVMRSLVEHSTDNVNQLSESVQEMQKTLQQQNTDSQSQDRSGLRADPDPQRFHRRTQVAPCQDQQATR